MDRASLGAAIAPPLYTPETSPSALRAMQTRFAAPAASTATPQVPEELQRIGHEFKSMFISEMLKPMFEGLSTDELGGGGVGEDTWRPLLIERYGEAMTRSGGVGIADTVVRELMRMQAAQNPAPLPEPTMHPIEPRETEGSDHGAHG